MDKLELKIKSSNPFAKGKSRFSVTILILQRDIDNFNIPQELLGQSVTLTPKAWAEITFPDDTYLGQRKIAARCAADEKDRAKGRPERDQREIVGLEYYTTRNAGKDYYNVEKSVKAKYINKSKAMNSFLFGR